MKLALCVVAFSLINFSYASSLKHDLDKIISKYQKGNSFQGTVKVFKKGKEIYRKNLGFASVEHKVKIQSDTVFQVGSLTKQFVAVGILKLFEMGKIDLDGNVSQYLKTPKHWEDVTIHHLLTHTSALKRNAPITTKESSAFHTLKDVFDSISSESLRDKQKPGDKFAYSNAGYSVLAYIIEVVSQKSYQEFMNKFVFGPAKLNSTGVFHQSLIVPNRAEGYVVFKSNDYRACCFDYTNTYGAGDVYSTADELFKWYTLLKSNLVISKKSLDLLFTEHIQHSRQSWSYGYGWIIDKYKGSDIIWHNGSVNGFLADLSIMPNKEIFTVILSNKVVRPTTFYLDKFRNNLIDRVLLEK
ncbi:MAG: beta-lactamase family protein [Bacteriovoracaceae bacterium]|nr:beta-lactamase family protein [Bacteriovoracaceae bacterium]